MDDCHRYEVEYFGSQVVVYSNTYLHGWWNVKITTPAGKVVKLNGAKHRLHSKRSALKKGWWEAKRLIVAS